jgi:hypothetical protein
MLSFLKFLLLVLILVAYFAYVSYKYNVATGGLVTAITWSFFVLCTPIADGGFLIDFPLRLLFKVRMVYTEIIVWLTAISISIYAIYNHPAAFQINVLTSMFFKILTNPWPYWLLILLSFFGTFISIVFGDEVFDSVISKQQNVAKIKSNKRVRVLVLSLLFGIVLLSNSLILKQLNIELI